MTCFTEKSLSTLVIRRFFFNLNRIFYFIVVTRITFILNFCILKKIDKNHTYYKHYLPEILIKVEFIFTKNNLFITLAFL